MSVYVEQLYQYFLLLYYNCQCRICAFTVYSESCQWFQGGCNLLILLLLTKNLIMPTLNAELPGPDVLQPAHLYLTRDPFNRQ